MNPDDIARIITEDPDIQNNPIYRFTGNEALTIIAKYLKDNGWDIGGASDNGIAVRANYIKLQDFIRQNKLPDAWAFIDYIAPGKVRVWAIDTFSGTKVNMSDPDFFSNLIDALIYEIKLYGGLA